MKKLLHIIILLLPSFPNICLAQSNKVEPALEFLKDFDKIRDFTINSSTDEAYFTLQSPLEEICIIACIKKVGDQWGEPIIYSFTGQFRDLEPFLSPDGKRLYFASNRPTEESSPEPKDFDIWYVERQNAEDDWGEPVNLGVPVNSEHNEFYPAITNSGNLYITSDRPDSKGQDDIFFCSWLGERYDEPQSISDAINTGSYEFNAYVAPDESFLIFSGYNREDGYGSGDMYISYRNEQMEWMPAINMGEEINSKYMDYCPFVDIQNNTMYFTSRRSSINSEDKIQSIGDFRKIIDIYENGNSRIYQVPFSVKHSTDY